MVMVTLVSACNSFHAPAGESPAEACAPANEGKTVSVAGYLVQPFFSLECEKSCYLWVSASSGEEAGIYAHFTAGPGPNQMRPVRGKGSLTGAGAERAAKSAFHLQDDTGKRSFGIDDTVRVTGVLTTKTEGGKLSCRLEVARVEATP
jgi:hypothetical protein